MPGWRPNREVIEMARGKNDKNSTRSPSSNAILLPIRLLVRLCKKNGSRTVSGFSSLDPYTTHYPGGGGGGSCVIRG